MNYQRIDRRNYTQTNLNLTSKILNEKEAKIETNFPKDPIDTRITLIQQDLLYLKNDILKNNKSMEARIDNLIDAAINQIEKYFEPKINSLSEKINIITNSKTIDLLEEKFKQNFKELNTLNSKLQQEISVIRSKYEMFSRQINESVDQNTQKIQNIILYPGIIGPNSKYSSFHNFIDFVLKSINNLIINSKLINSINEAQKNCKTKMKETMDRVNQQSNNITSSCLENYTKTLNESQKKLNLVFEENMMSIKTENAQFYSRIEDTVNQLSSDFKKILQNKKITVKTDCGCGYDLLHLHKEIKYINQKIENILKFNSTSKDSKNDSNLPKKINIISNVNEGKNSNKNIFRFSEVDLCNDFIKEQFNENKILSNNNFFNNLNNKRKIGGKRFSVSANVYNMKMAYDKIFNYDNGIAKSAQHSNIEEDINNSNNIKINNHDDSYTIKNINTNNIISSNENNNKNNNIISNIDASENCKTIKIKSAKSRHNTLRKNRIKFSAKHEKYNSQYSSIKNYNFDNNNTVEENKKEKFPILEIKKVFLSNKPSKEDSTMNWIFCNENKIKAMKHKTKFERNRVSAKPNKTKSIDKIDKRENIINNNNKLCFCLKNSVSPKQKLKKEEITSCKNTQCQANASCEIIVKKEENKQYFRNKKCTLNSLVKKGKKNSKNENGGSLNKNFSLKSIDNSDNIHTFRETVPFNSCKNFNKNNEKSKII